MPGLGNVQADYNSAKATLATLQSAVDAAAAALLAHEQACEVLDADGANPIAEWLRASARLTSAGYKTFGNCGAIAIYARDPSVTRDNTVPNSIGPVTAVPGRGFVLTP